MSERATARAGGWGPFFSKGESAVAPTGLALVLILAGAMAAAGWWSTRAQDESLQQARVDEVRAVGNTLATTVEALLRRGDLSGARRLIMTAAHQHELATCQILTRAGQVVADADPSRINVTTLDDVPVFPSPDQQPVFLADGTAVTVSYPIEAQRRTLRLSIVAGPRDGRDHWSLQAGVGAVGATSLVVLMLLYRQLRRRLRPLYAIGESLGAFTAGESDIEALAVSPSFGADAQAWNRILAQRQERQNEQLERDASAAVRQRSGVSGDLADACNALSQGLIVVDDQLHFVYLNGAAAVFLGARRDELIHQPMAQAGLSEPVADAIRQAVCGPLRQRRTLEIDRSQGQSEGVLRFSIRPVSKGDTSAAVIAVDDITQQRVAAQSRNTFLAQATHELRMPLTNIRLYLDTAIENGDEDAKLRGECLNVINQESRRLEKLVTDMLSISEIEAGSMSLTLDDVRLDALFDALEQDYRAQAEDKQISLAFNLPPKLPVIQADRDRLIVALQNLVGNACKYTPVKGHVSVSVDATDDVLSVEVKDSGIGIAEKDLGRIFEKFCRAEDRRIRDIQGTGLGLSLAREIVRLHGGDITVESVVDRGTTFTITLPISVEAA